MAFRPWKINKTFFGGMQRLRVFLFLSLLAAWHSYSFVQPALLPTLLSPRLTVGVPATFLPLTEEELLERFGSNLDYLGAYASPQEEAILLVTRSFAHWKAGDEAIMQSFLRANILSLYGAVDFLSLKVIELPKNKPAVFIEFVALSLQGEGTTPAPYVSMVAIAEHTSTVIVRFSCPKADKDSWQSLAQAIMHSLYFE